MVQNERASTFVTVACSCGRSLRAKAEQVGTEVRCWDCHKMVLVLDPNEGQRVARELSDSAMVVIKGPGLNAILVGASLITAVLVLPYYGTWCSIIALALGFSAYGEIIRRVSRGATEEATPGIWATLIPRSIPKLLLCLLMAAGTVGPLWLLNAGEHRSPRFNAIGRGVAALTWIVGPLLMLALYGTTGRAGPLGFRRATKLLAGHPFATLLALAVVPMTLFLLEAALLGIIYLSNALSFYTLDYMPMPAAPVAPIMHAGIPHYNNLDYRSFPDSMFSRAYFRGLRQGYSFVGAIPPSLSMSTRAGMDSNEAIGLPLTAYVLIRLLMIEVIMTCLVAAFAVQARWLGSIPALERSRSG